MIPLPRNLKIERDLEEEKNLLMASRAYLKRKPRTGIHATDLLDPRLAYFKALSGEELPDRLVNMFLVGQVAHISILRVMTGNHDYTDSDEGAKLFEGLQYSPDFMDIRGEPAEIKTTRSFYLPKVPYLPDDKTYHMYLEQLIIYMAAENKVTGRLVLLYLNHKEENKTTPSFFVFKITTTKEAIAAMRAVIKKEVAQLQLAKDTKDHTILPLCRPWKCRDCEFFAELCKPEGRWEHGQDKEKNWTA